MDATIKTNGHARELLAYGQLSDSARDWFEYYMGAPDEANDEHWMPRFFPYRGAWYDVNDGFDVTAAPEGWGAVQGESYFSAVLIRYAQEWDGSTDYGAVVVGYMHW